jgi:hypothetical protein
MTVFPSMLASALSPPPVAAGTAPVDGTALAAATGGSFSGATTRSPTIS